MNQSGFIYGGDYNPEQWLAMPEILEQYAQILEKENSNAEFIGLLRQERASLLEIGRAHV